MDDVWQNILERIDFTKFIQENLKINVQKSTKYSPAMARCLFHDDNNPSMAIYDDRDNPHYHCFSCGAHGGVLELTEKARGLSRSEALKFVADELGVVLPTHIGRRTTSKDSVSRSLKIISEHSDKSLMKNFSEDRGFSIDVLQRHGVNAVDLRSLLAGDLSLADRAAFSEAGFARGYDPLRLTPIMDGPCVILPILRDRHPVGALFRSLRDDPGKGERYRFNDGFQRGRELYGYDDAASALLEMPGSGDALHVYIVEGVTDALRLQGLGLHAVALFGTAITQRQLTRVADLAEEGLRLEVGVYFHVFMDGDAAGRFALRRVLGALLGRAQSSGGDIRPVPVNADVIWAPDDLDPDDLLKGLSSEQAQKFLEEHCYPPIAALIAVWRAERRGGQPPVDEGGGTASGPGDPEYAISTLESDTAFERFQFSRSLDALFGYRLNELIETGVLFRTVIAESAVLPEPVPAETRRYRNLAADLRRAGQGFPSVSDSALAKAGEVPADDVEKLALAQRIAASSIQRREFPNDWAGWRLVAETSDYFHEILSRRLQVEEDKAAPYLARFIPRESGGARLKAGPWVDEAILQQYMLSAILGEPGDGKSWPDLVPAVRRDPSGRSYQTGPRDLLAYPDGPRARSVVSFGYMVATGILEGIEEPERQGLFVPYSECWNEFVGSFYSFTFEAPLSIEKFYAVRLDIHRFYDEIPRYAVDEILRQSLVRAFSDSEIQPDRVAPLFRPGIKSGDQRAAAIASWVVDRSFGFNYQHPGTGALTRRLNPSIGIPQGPDLSAYLANIVLFALDRAVVQEIEAFSDSTDNDGGARQPRAIYGRYVDDMVVIASSSNDLARLESTINRELAKLGLKATNKVGRPPSMTRQQLRAWLTSGRGMGKSGYADDGPSGTSRLPTLFDDAVGVGAPVDRSEALEELFSISGTSKAMDLNHLRRRLPSLLQIHDLRHYDKVRIAQMAILSVAASEECGQDETGGKTSEESLAALERIWRFWCEDLEQERSSPNQGHGEGDDEYQLRASMIVGAPLIQFIEALEFAFNSRFDRARSIDIDLREKYARARMLLRSIFATEIVPWIDQKLKDERFWPHQSNLRFMLVQHARILASLVGGSNGTERSVTVGDISEGSGDHIMISWLGSDISKVKETFSKPGDRTHAVEGFASAVSVRAHEIAARLAYAQYTNDSGSDPLEPIEPVELDLENEVLPLLATLLPERGPKKLRRTPDKNLVSAGFRAFLSATSPNSILGLLPKRWTLVGGEYPQFRDTEPLGVPGGLKTSALLAVESTDSDRTRIHGLVLDGEKPEPRLILGNKTEPFKIVDDESVSLVKAAIADLPNDVQWLDPDANNLIQSSVRDRARAFLESLRVLASTEKLDLNNSDNAIPFTKYNFVCGRAQVGTPRATGLLTVLNDGQPIGTKAYVGARDGSRHVITRQVDAAAAPYWRLTIALADLYGFIDYFRLPSIERFLADPIALSSDDDNERVVDELMRLVLPFLVGVLAKRIPDPTELVGRWHRTIDRTERFLSTTEHDLTQPGLAILVETIAEARFEAAIIQHGAAIQVQRRCWPDLIADSAFKAVQSSEFLVRYLDRPTLNPDNDGLLNRGANAWLAIASRYSSVERYANEDDRTFAMLVPVGAKLHAIRTALRSLAYELLGCLSETDRSYLRNFQFSMDDLGLTDIPILVDERSGVPDAALAAHRQPNLLLTTLALLSGARANFGGGGGQRSESVTLLGWAVSVAVLLRLVDLEVDFQAVGENLDEVQRPDLSAIAVSDAARNARRVSKEPSERRRLSEQFDRIAERIKGLVELPLQISEAEFINRSHSAFQATRDSDLTGLIAAVRAFIGEARAWAGLTYEELTTESLSPRYDQANGAVRYDVTGLSTRRVGAWQATYVDLRHGFAGQGKDYERVPEDSVQKDSNFLAPVVLAETRQGKNALHLLVLSDDLSRLAFGDDARFFPWAEVSEPSYAPSELAAEMIASSEPTSSALHIVEARETPRAEYEGANQESRTSEAATDEPDKSTPASVGSGDVDPGKSVSHPEGVQRAGIGDIEGSSGPGGQGDSRVTPLDTKNLNELRKYQEYQWRQRSAQTQGLLQTTNCRVAILQLPCAVVGESHSPSLAEDSSAYDAKCWKTKIQNRLKDSPGKSTASQVPSLSEALRRTVLDRALGACRAFGVDLLILPEYSMRPDSVNWLGKELNKTPIEPGPAVLAGTFRLAPTSLSDMNLASEFEKWFVETEDFKKDDLKAFASILPLLYPHRDANEEVPSAPWRLVCRAKKYPSAGQGEFIRPFEGPIRPLGSYSGLLESPNYRQSTHPLDYTQELICSEAFVFMTPFAHQAMASLVMESKNKIENTISKNDKYSEFKEGFARDQEILMTASAKQSRRPDYGCSRRTILCLPAVTSRPMDHHLFAQANFAASGSVCAFANMGFGSNLGGSSCFIGDSLKDDAHGFQVHPLASPYHGIAPGIFSRRQKDHPGSLLTEEMKDHPGALSGDEMSLVVADIDPVYTSASKPRTHDGLPPLRLVAHLPIFLSVGTEIEKKNHGLKRHVQCAKELNELVRNARALEASSSGGFDSNSAAQALKDTLSNLANISKPHEGWLNIRRLAALNNGILAPHGQVCALPAAFDWMVAELSQEDIDAAIIETWSIAGFDPSTVGQLDVE